MWNGWDERRGWDGEESGGSPRQGGLSGKSLKRVIGKIPDRVVKWREHQA
jgi:hypothetical protein